MKKENFLAISKNYNDLLEKIENFNNSFKLENVLSLSDSKFGEFLATCKDLMSKSDLILTTELYHVLGMGGLSGSQREIIMKIMRKISDARVRLKEIFCSESALKQARALLRPKATHSYKLSVGGTTLTKTYTNSVA